MELAIGPEDQSSEKCENCEEDANYVATLDLVKQTKITFGNLSPLQCQQLRQLQKRTLIHS